MAAGRYLRPNAPFNFNRACLYNRCKGPRREIKTRYCIAVAKKGGGSREGRVRNWIAEFPCIGLRANNYFHKSRILHRLVIFIFVNLWNAVDRQKRMGCECRFNNRSPWRARLTARHSGKYGLTTSEYSSPSRIRDVSEARRINNAVSPNGRNWHDIAFRLCFLLPKKFNYKVAASRVHQLFQLFQTLGNDD